MRLGWMQLPSWLAWPLIQVKATEDAGTESIGQLALHDFIERGELDRHLRRTRHLYERRREALAQAVMEHLPDAQLGEGNAGLYETLALPTGTNEAAVIAAAAERGLGIEGLSLHSFTAKAPPTLGPRLRLAPGARDLPRNPTSSRSNRKEVSPDADLHPLPASTTHLNEQVRLRSTASYRAGTKKGAGSPLQTLNCEPLASSVWRGDPAPLNLFPLSGSAGFSRNQPA